MAEPEQERVLAVRTTVQRYVAGRTDEDREDVVQEAMTRLLENRSRLEPGAWASYAVVSAGNLLRDRERLGSVTRRHQHRLYLPDAQPGPEDRVVTAEEHAAVQRAMAALEEPDASVLADHYLLAERSNRSVRPATAARLARARVKLRVAYVLEHGRRPLPTPRCRPVLEALSTGDRRRQERLGTARHLLACSTCATYAPALLERRRALAGLAPLSWIAATGSALWAAVRRHPGRTASATGVVALAAVLGATALTAAPERTPPVAVAVTSSAPALVVAGAAVDLDAVGGGAALSPGPAQGREVPVQAVVADEGFWIGTGPHRRVWLQLVGNGESPERVEVGDRVSFHGTAVALAPGAVGAMGVTPAEGSAELESSGAYLQVERAALVVTPGRLPRRAPG